MKKNKFRILGKSIFLDITGMATMAIPVVGPFLDIIWAPFAAKKMMELYPGKKGKIASVITFIEEILPFTDAIPTFTLMWLYTYVWNKSPESQMEPQTIEVEVVQ